MIGYRVVVAGRDGKSLKMLEGMLRMMGWIVVGKAGDGVSAIRQVMSTQPDYVILSGEPGFLETAKTVEEDSLAPLLLLTDPTTRLLMEREIDTWGFDTLDWPVRQDSLKLKMRVGHDRYREKIERIKEQEQIHSQESTRNLVERAKDILVQGLGISELQALNRIQILGRTEGLSMRAMAEKIIAQKSTRIS